MWTPPWEKWVLLIGQTVVAFAASLVVCVAIGAGVTINGPNELDVKESDLFFVEGLTLDEFKQCTVYIRPEVNKPQVLVLQTLNNLPVLYVKGRSAGTFDIMLDVNVPEKFELVFHSLVIGEDDVNPPLPPIVLGEKYVVVLYEGGDRTNEEALKLAHLKPYLESKEVTLHYADKDQINAASGKAPAWLQPILKQVQDKKLVLPVLAIGSELEGVYFFVDTIDLPTTADAATFLKKNGVK